MAYFGDALAHSALLGVALALLLDVSVMAGVLAVTLAVALALAALRKPSMLPPDALLGIFAHGALAIGIIVTTLAVRPGFDLMGLLFGDILAVTTADVWIIGLGALIILAVLAAIWRPLLAAAVSEEIAIAEGLNPRRAELAHTLLLAAALALSMKITGVLLFTSLLVIPAAAARALARSPEAMAALAALSGMAAVLAGLYGSFVFDAPSGPSIVAAAFALFALFHMMAWLRRR
jgi:zinc transport system permease protein